MKTDMSCVRSNERFAIAIATLLYGKPSARSGDPLGKATGPRRASESNKPSLGATYLFFEMRIRNSVSVPMCLCGKRTLFPSFPSVQPSDIPLNPTKSRLKNLKNYPDAHVSDLPPSSIQSPVPNPLRINAVQAVPACPTGVSPPHYRVPSSALPVYLNSLSINHGCTRSHWIAEVLCANLALVPSFCILPSAFCPKDGLSLP
jgi:hypothetical protein